MLTATARAADAWIRVGSNHFPCRMTTISIQCVVTDAERNALRANLAVRDEDWRWGSLYRWKRGAAQERSLLAAWPLPRRSGWVEHVNAPHTDAELAILRRSVQRGCPFGESSWGDEMVRRLGLESTLRPRG